MNMKQGNKLKRNIEDYLTSNNWKKVKFDENGKKSKPLNSIVTENITQKRVIQPPHYQKSNLSGTISMDRSNSHRVNSVNNNESISMVEVKEKTKSNFNNQDDPVLDPLKILENENVIRKKIQSQFSKNKHCNSYIVHQEKILTEQYKSTEPNVSLKMDKIYMKDKENLSGNKNFVPLAEDKLRSKKCNEIYKCRVCFVTISSEKEWLLHHQSTEHQVAFESFKNNLEIQLTAKEKTTKVAVEKSVESEHSQLYNANPTNIENINFEVKSPVSYPQPVNYFPINLLKRRVAIFGNVEKIENEFRPKSKRKKGKHLHKKKCKNNTTTTNYNTSELPLIFLPYQVRVKTVSGKPELFSMFVPYFDQNFSDSLIKGCWSLPSDSWIGECVEPIKEKINVSFNSKSETKQSDMLVSRLMTPAEKETSINSLLKSSNVSKQVSVLNENNENINPKSVGNCMVDKSNTDLISFGKKTNLNTVKIVNKYEDPPQETKSLRKYRTCADTQNMEDNNSLFSIDNQIREKSSKNRKCKVKTLIKDNCETSSISRKESTDIEYSVSRRYNTRRSSIWRNRMKDDINSNVRSSVISKKTVNNSNKLNISKKRKKSEVFIEKIPDDEFSLETFQPVPVQNVSPMYLIQAPEEEKHISERNDKDIKEKKTIQSKKLSEYTEQMPIWNNNNDNDFSIINPSSNSLEHNKNINIKTVNNNKSTKEHGKLNDTCNESIVSVNKKFSKNFKNILKGRDKNKTFSPIIKENIKKEKSTKFENENQLSFPLIDDKAIDNKEEEIIPCPFLEASVCIKVKKVSKKEMETYYVKSNDSEKYNFKEMNIIEDKILDEVVNEESVFENTVDVDENIIENNGPEKESHFIEDKNHLKRNAVKNESHLEINKQEDQSDIESNSINAKSFLENSNKDEHIITQNHETESDEETISVVKDEYLSDCIEEDESDEGSNFIKAESCPDNNSNEESMKSHNHEIESDDETISLGDEYLSVACIEEDEDNVESNSIKAESCLENINKDKYMKPRNHEIESDEETISAEDGCILETDFEEDEIDVESNFIEDESYLKTCTNEIENDENIAIEDECDVEVDLSLYKMSGYMKLLNDNIYQEEGTTDKSECSAVTHEQSLIAVCNLPDSKLCTDAKKPLLSSPKSETKEKSNSVKKFCDKKLDFFSQEIIKKDINNSEQFRKNTHSPKDMKPEETFVNIEHSPIFPIYTEEDHDSHDSLTNHCDHDYSKLLVGL